MKIIVYVYVALLLSAYTQLVAQNSGDYRSIASGNWSELANWEIFDGAVWGAATLYPGQDASEPTVYIGNGNVVTVDISPANPIGGIQYPASCNITTEVVFNAGVNLTVNGPVIFTATVANNRSEFLWVNDGNLSCDYLKMVNTGSDSRKQYAVVNDGNLTVNGDVELFAGGGTKNRLGITGSGSIVVTGDFSKGNGRLKEGTGSSIYVGGDFNVSAFVKEAGTIYFNGNTDQQIDGVVYNNVVVQGGGVKSLLGNLTSEDFTIADAATTFKSAGSDFTVNGDFTLDGIYLDDNNGGTNYFYQKVTVNASGEWNSLSVTTDSRCRFYNGIENNGVMNIGGSRFYANDQSITGASSILFNSQTYVIGDITVTNSNTATTTHNGRLRNNTAGSVWVCDENTTTYYNNATYPMSGSTLDADQNNCTFYYSGSTNQTIKGAAYHNLIVNNGAGSYSKTLAGNTTVANIFAIASNTYFDPSSYNFDVAGLTVINGIYDDDNANGISTLNSVNLNGGSIHGGQLGVVDINGTLTIPSSSTIGYVDLSANGPVTITDGITLSFINSAGTATFGQKLTVPTDVVWDNTGNSKVNFENGLDFQGATFNSGTGTYSFITNNQDVESTIPLTFDGRVTIGAGVTATNLVPEVIGGITIDGILDGTDASSTFENRTICYYNSGTVPMSTGILDCSFNCNTFVYSRNNDQTIKSATYCNLIAECNNNRSKTMSGDVTVLQNLSIKPTTYFDPLSYNLDVQGTARIEGIFDDDNAVGVSDIQNIDLAGGQINGGATGLLNVLGTFTVSASGSVGRVQLAIDGQTTIADNQTLTINSATGSKTFKGNLAINNGAAWSNTANCPIEYQGGISHNGAAFASGTGLQSFTTNNQSIEGATDLIISGAVSVSDSDTVTNNLNLTINGALDGAGATAVFKNNANLYYKNAAMPMLTGKLDASEAGNTVYYSRAGGQTIATTAYQDVVFEGSGTKTLLTDIDVLQDVNINSSAGSVIIKLATGNLNVNNNLISNGSFRNYLDVDVLNVLEDLQVQSSRLSFGDDANYTINLKNIIVDNGAVLDVQNRLHVVSLSGDFTNNGEVDFYNNGTNRVHLKIVSDIPHAINGTPTKFELAGLELNANSNTTTIADGTELLIIRATTIGSNSVLVAGANKHTVTGNWNNSGTLISAGSTFSFNGNGQFIYDEPNFNNVEFTGTGNRNIYIDGDVVINGNTSINNTNPANYTYVHIGNDATARNITMKGDLTIDDVSGLFTRNIDGIHTLNLGGNVTINGGYFDMYSNANRRTAVHFIDNNPHVVSGTPTRLEFYDLFCDANSNTATFQTDPTFYSDVTIQNNAGLTIANGVTAYINSGNSIQNSGTFSVVGLSGDPATIDVRGGTGTYTITQADALAEFNAQYYVFSHLGNDGITISDGSINATNNFSNGEFINCTGNQLLKLDGVDLTGLPDVQNVIFNTGTTYNITRTTGTGAITFSDATGALSGENYDNDNGVPGTLIRWRYPARTFYSQADGSFSPASNWNTKQDGSGTDAVLADFTAGDATFVIQNGHEIVLDTDLNILGLEVGEGASGKLTIGNDATTRFLTVNEYMEIKNGATLTKSAINSTDTLYLKGYLENNGTVNFKNTSSQIVNTVFQGPSAAVNGTASPRFNHIGFDANNYTEANVAFNIDGNVTIETGAVFNSGNYTHTVEKNWTENGTGAMTGTSTIEFNGIVNQITTDATFHNITFKGGGAGSIIGNISVNNDFTVNNSTAITTTNNLYVAGDYAITDGNYNQTGGTIYFNGTDPQSIDAANSSFRTVDFSNGAANAKTITGDLTATGRVTIQNGATVDGAGTHTFSNGLRVNGDCNFSGELILKAGLLDNTVGNTIELGTADVTVNGGTIDVNNADDVTVNGDFTISSGTFRLYDGSTLKGNATNAFVMNGSALHTVEMQGVDNFPSNFTSYSLNNSSRALYSRNGNQTVRSGFSYGELELGGSGIKTASGNIDVDGNLDLNGGITFNTGLFQTSIAGNIENGSGSIINSTGFLLLDAPDANQTVGTGAYNFTNFLISNDAPSNIRTKTFSSGSNISIANAIVLANTGGDEANFLSIDFTDNTITGGNSFNVTDNTEVRTSAGTGAGSFKNSLASFATVTLSPSSTIDYYLNGDQDLADGFAYGKIEFSNSGNKIAHASLNIDGGLFRMGGAPDFVDGGLDHYVSGDWSLSSAYYTVPTGTIIFDGQDQKIYTAYFNNVEFAGTDTKRLFGNINLIGNLQINDNSTFDADEFDIQLKGNFTTAANGIFKQTTDGRVTFNDTTKNQSLTSNANSYFGDIIINNKDFILDLNSEITIEGSFISTIDRTGFNANGNTIYVAKHWDSYTGTRIDLSGSTLVFNGPSVQRIRTEGGETFNNVEFIGAGEKRLVDAANSPHNPFDVDGDFTINGATVVGNGACGGNCSIDVFVAGDWVNTGSFQHDGRTLTFDGADQLISSSDFGHVVMSGTGTKRITGSIQAVGNLIIDDNVTFDAGDDDNDNYSITVGRSWINDSINSTFISRKSTVVLNGNGYNIYTGGNGPSKEFYNVNINLGLGDNISLRGDMTVNNDFIINNGIFYVQDNDMLIKGLYQNNGDFRQNNSQSLVTFASTVADTVDFDPGVNHYFRNVTFDGNSTIYKVARNINTANVNDINFEIKNSNLFLNGYELELLARWDTLTVGADGKLEFGNGGFVKMGRDGRIIIDDATATLDLVGIPAAPAKIGRSSTNTVGYSIIVNDGTVHAQNYQIENTDNNGFEMLGGTIDATDNFSYGIFTGGAGNAYLTLTNDFADFTTKEIIFNSGPTHNVSRTTGAGQVTIQDAGGLIVGEAYEEEESIAHNRIDWTFPTGFKWDGEGITDSWHESLNWDGNTVPSANDIVYLDHDHVAGNYNVEISNANASAKRLVTDDQGSGNGLTLNISNGYDLDIDQFVNIGANTSVNVTNSGSDIFVGSHWYNSGTFNHGNAKVTFDGPAAIYTIATGGMGAGKSFYDIEFSSAGSTFNLSNELDADGDITVTDATLDVTTSNYDIYVGGNLDATSGILELQKNTVIFDGSANQSLTGGNFNNLKIDNPAAVALTGGIDIDGTLTIEQGQFDGNTQSIYVGNDWINNSGLAAFSQTGIGTVYFDATTGTQDVDYGTSATTFNNLIFGTSRTKRFGNNSVVNGDMTLTSDCDYVYLYDHVISGSGAANNLTLSTGSVLVIGGANNFPSTFENLSIADNSTVMYEADIDQTVYATTYGHLTLRDGPGAATQTKTIADDIIVAGNMNISDVNTTVDFATNDANLNLTRNLSVATGTPQINWGTGDATLIHNGGDWNIDRDISTFNNLILQGTGTKRQYSDLAITGNVEVRSNIGLSMHANNTSLPHTMTSDGTGTFSLSDGARVYCPIPSTTGVAFPTGFSSYTLSPNSTVYLNSPAGIDQTIYTGVTYGGITINNAIKNVTLDGVADLDVNGIFYMGDNTLNYATLTDAGKDLYLGGSEVNLNYYTPSSSARTVYFDGANQNIRDRISQDFQLPNVVFAGSGTKTFNDGNDSVIVSGNLTVNNNVIVNNNCDIAFKGNTWTNNGEFYALSREVLFDKATNQTIDPGEDHNFIDIRFSGAGTKTFTNYGADVNDDFTISSGTVDLGALNHTIADDMETQAGTLISNNANINFDGGTQSIITNELFLNNVTTSNSGTKYIYAKWNINDLHIEAGTSLNTSDGQTTPTYSDIDVLGNWLNEGTFVDNTATVTFDGSTSPVTITSGGSNFYDVVFAPSAAVTYTLESPNTRFARSMDIGTDATLDMNGKELYLGSNLGAGKTYNVDGTLEVDGNATLRFNQQSSAGVMTVAGKLSIVGDDIVNTATVTRETAGASNANRPEITVSGEIAAQYYLIEYISKNGLNVTNTATLDPVQNFSDGVWSNMWTATNQGSQYYLILDAGTYTGGDITNVAFNFSATPTMGIHYNVKRSEPGTITFNTPIGGNLGSFEYEDDDFSPNSGLLHWPPVSKVVWTGAKNTNWHDIENWSPKIIPNASIDAEIPGISGGVTNNPIVSNANAECKKITLTDGILTLDSDYDLIATGDIIIGTGSNSAFLTVATTGSDIICGGYWDVGGNGVFVNGGAKVTFTSGSGIAVIKPRTSAFNDIEFDNAATLFQLEGSTINVNGDFTINEGTMQPTIDNYKLYVKGNYNNLNGLFDLTKNGTVFFDKNGNQDITHGHFRGCTLGGTGTKSVYSTASYQNTLSVNSNYTIAFGTTVELDGDVYIDATGTFVDGNVTTTFSGVNWTGLGTYTGNGTIECDRNGGQNFHGASFNNLDIQNASGDINLYGDIDVRGDFTVASSVGRLDLNTHQLASTTGTSAFTIGAIDVYVEGADNFPSNFASYDLDYMSRVFYNGSVDQIISPQTYGAVILDDATTKTLGGNVLIRRDLNFNEATLDVSTNNYQIEIKGSWNNNILTTPGTFIGRESEVKFTNDAANQNIRLSDNADNDFYMVFVDKPSYNLYINRNTLFKKDLLILDGTFAAGNNKATVSGNLQAVNGTITSNDTIVLNKPSGTAYLNTNGSTIQHLKIDGASTMFELEDDLTLNGSLIVKSGTFDGNGLLMQLGNGADVVSIAGKFITGAGAILRLANTNFVVEPTGHFEAIGAAGDIITFTRRDNNERYTLSVNGTISAKYCLFEYMDASGITINPGATIDTDNNFSYSTFTNGQNNGKFLKINNNQRLTGANKIIDVSFPKAINGASNNVEKTVATDTVEFYNATGVFAGEALDSDPNDLIVWTGPVTLTWTGDGGDTDWYNSNNWKASVGPDLVPDGSQDVVITKTHPVTLNTITNQPIIDISGATCKNLYIESGATLTLASDANGGANDLDVNGIVDIDGTMVMSSTDDYMTVSGNWSNTGTTAINGTITFDADDAAKTVDNGSGSFYNLVINSNTTVQISRDTRINGDLTISGGTFDVSNNDLYIKGSFTSNGNFFSQTGGKVFFTAASGTHSISPGTGAFQNVDINASGAVYQLGGTMYVNRLFNVLNGTLDLNGQDLYFGDNSGPDYMSVSGTMTVDANANLYMGNNSYLTVNSGGTLNMLGDDDSNIAHITRRSTGDYSIAVNSGATVAGNYYLLEYLDNTGLHIKSGATIDSSNPLSNGTFSNGTTGGTYITMENDVTVGVNDTAYDVVFNNGPTYNATRLVGNNTFVFKDPRGLLGSYLYERDELTPNGALGKLAWAYTNPTLSWTGAADSRWDNANNWDNLSTGQSPSAEPPSELFNVFIPDADLTPNDPVIDAAVVQDTARALNVMIFPDGELFFDGDKPLVMEGEFTNAGIVEVLNNSANEIQVGGNWANAGTFTSGNSTIRFKATSGIITITPNSEPFNDLIFENCADYVLDENIEVSGDVTIENCATVDVSANNYEMYVSGNWINNGTFFSKEGSVYFNGTGTQTVSGGSGAGKQFYNFYKNNTSAMTLSGDIDIQNEFVISKGSIDGGDNTIHIAKDWEVIGTATVTNSSVEFTGSSLNILTNYSAIEFNDFTMNKFGAGNDLVLNKGITVNGTLTLTGGDIRLGAFRMNLGPQATVSGGSENSYIQLPNSGYVIKEYDATTVFPQETYFASGHEDNFTPMRFTMNSATVSSSSHITFDIVDREILEIHDLTTPVQCYITRTWILEPNDLSDVNYNLEYVYLDEDYDTLTFNPALEGSMLAISYSNGQFYGNGSVDPVTNTITWDGLEHFSEYSAGLGEELPVELIYFHADAYDEYVYLGWATASEKNNSHFIVERSQDGNVFVPIKQIKGEGNSSVEVEYSMIDTEPLSGVLYYRLKQVDFNGDVNYSNPISVQFLDNYDLFNYVIYPNPLTDDKVLKIGLENIPAEKVTIRILTAQGALLYRMEIAEEGENSINLQNLQQGVYFMYIESEGESFTETLIVD